MSGQVFFHIPQYEPYFLWLKNKKLLAKGIVRQYFAIQKFTKNNRGFISLLAIFYGAFDG